MLRDQTPFVDFLFYARMTTGNFGTARPFSYNQAGPETIVVLENRELYSHFVYNNDLDATFGKFPVRVDISIDGRDHPTDQQRAVYRGSLVSFPTPAYPDVTSSLPRGPLYGKYWHTFSVDLDSQPPRVNELNVLSDSPESPDSQFQTMWD